MRFVLPFLVLLAALLPGACGGGGGGGAKLASAYPADVATSWYDLAYRLTRSESLSPPVASRVFGYLGVALYESVVPGIPSNRSLAGLVNGQLVSPKPQEGEAYSWPIAANAALATVMPAFYQKETSYLAIANLHDKNRDEVKDGASVEVVARSEEFGRSVGIAVMRWALGDGYESIKDCAYQASEISGRWVPTIPARAKALEPCWGRLRPFVMESVARYRSGPPTPYSEDPSSRFYAEAMEVYLARKNLTAEQREIALYWADNPGQTGTPPGHSLAIATQLITERHKSLDFAAEAYARVGMAVADAFVACWDTKYVYDLVRPVTYIQSWIDPDWTPLLTTPPFPEFTSGHSVQTGAAATVLQSMFGNGQFTDRTHEAAGRQPRTFSSFGEMASETAISRLYAGIHYRPAIDVGVEQGNQIGQAVVVLKLTK